MINFSFTRIDELPKNIHEIKKELFRMGVCLKPRLIHSAVQRIKSHFESNEIISEEDIGDFKGTWNILHFRCFFNMHVLCCCMELHSQCMCSIFRRKTKRTNTSLPQEWNKDDGETNKWGEGRSMASIHKAVSKKLENQLWVCL